MLVTSKEMLLKAQKNHYAVGAFNAENMEMVMAIIQTATQLNAPVIIQTTPSTIRYAGENMYQAMVKALAEKAPIPVAMHLDHGDEFSLFESALKAGYTSLMIDGSHKKFEENIALTKKAVDFAREHGIPVEAELGSVGGKEDDLEAQGGCTDPMQAVEFVQRTGIDSLAIAIGTAHGVYKKEPKLDIERLKEICKVVDIPLVLHGASGLSEDAVKTCIQEGICKVNFATELRVAYTQAIRNFLQNDATVFDPKKYGKAAIEAVKEAVRIRMEVCGCVGKAGEA